MTSKHQKAFTLVELIVVITILAILATIAFISLQGYASSARNAARISDVRTIEKGLSIYSTRNSTIPLPNESFSVTASGEVLMYQGVFGTGALAEIRQATFITDPSSGEFYTYSVTPNRGAYQILANLDNSGYKSSGSPLGILVDESGQSFSEVFTGATVDLLSASSYLLRIDNEQSISGSGQLLLADVEYFKEAKKYDDSLIFYTDLSSLTSSGTIRDFSFQGNDLQCFKNASGVPCEKLVQLSGVMNFDGTMFLRPDNLVYDMQISEFTYMAKINFDGRTGGAVLGQYTRDVTVSSYENHAFRLFPTALVYENWPPGGGGFKPLYTLPASQSIWITLRRDGFDGTYFLGDEVIVTGSGSSTMEVYPELHEWRIQNFAIGAQTRLASPYYTRGFNGFIDEVRIYNRPLSDEEISIVVQ